MASFVNVQARVRKLLESLDISSADTEQEMTLSEQLEQLVAIGSSPYEETTKLGRSFKVNNSTAVAAVTALPTTAVNAALYNNATDGGRSLIIDRVWALQIAAATQADANTLIGLLGQVREAAPADAGLLFRKLNGYGGGSSDTMARTIIGGTALPATTGIAADWFPMPNQVTNAQVGAFIGCVLDCRVDGRIIVPPGRYFALHVLSGHTTNTFIVGFEYHEKRITLQ